MLCENGCGLDAKFKTKSGKNICAKSINSCPEQKIKNSNGIKKAVKEGKYLNRIVSDKGRRKQAVNKGKTKYNCERLKRQGETFSRHLKEGKIKHSMSGRKLSDKHRNNLSKARINYLENNDNHCAWFKFENKGKIVRVQGTWEKRFAEFLISNRIKWDRFYLKYDKTHRYTPDFYLEDEDVFIEVKGWMKDRDIIKMKKVLIEHDVKIYLVESTKIIEELDLGKIKIKDLILFEEKYP